MFLLGGHQFPPDSVEVAVKGFMDAASVHTETSELASQLGLALLVRLVQIGLLLLAVHLLQQVTQICGTYDFNLVHLAVEPGFDGGVDPRWRAIYEDLVLKKGLAHEYRGLQCLNSLRCFGSHSFCSLHRIKK